MTPTTATTGSPPATGLGELTVRQRVSEPCPTVSEAVQQRITELRDRGARTFTLKDMEPAAQCSGRPLSWIGDHLIVLEGIGILRPAERSGERRWSVEPGSEYLR